MNLYDLVSRAKLAEHIKNRMISEQRHPTLPLRILNYTPKAQFAGIWGDGTIDYCRGLIVDDDNKIVSRPFKKFHNLNTPSIPETMEENLPHVVPEITEKFDGSLGILYRYASEWGIATRGSFTSPQALWATDYFKKLGYPYKDFDFPNDWTPLFEIVYPENRIVVQYEWEGLILIGMIQNSTGIETISRALENIARDMNVGCISTVFESLTEALKYNEPNKEGFVATYFDDSMTPPLKVKIKMADYVRLHKILTGMNPRSIWEILSSTSDLSRFDNTPEHFRDWLYSWAFELGRQHHNLIVRAQDIFYDRPTPVLGSESSYRKECALYFQEKGAPELKSLFFAMLDNKPQDVIDSIAWKMIKPRGDDKSFRTEE